MYVDHYCQARHWGIQGGEYAGAPIVGHCPRHRDNVDVDTDL